jgi:pyruvate dehydrogenase E2 component (dihydrolipoamide acetyltransferase)
MRKTAARRLTEAWKVPHIVQMIDVDASGLLAERARQKERGSPASLNDLILYAAAQELRERPNLNATVEGDELVLYDSVDAGLAVDTDRGLVAPVLRNAGELSLEELASQMAGLIEAARAGRLPAENLGSASLTVSSLGPYGIRFGTPVINLGEPLLIFVGAIEDRPAVQNGRVVSRATLTLSIAYDHRVTDGLAAAEYTRALKQRLEAYAPSEAPLSPSERAARKGLDSREVVAVSEAGELKTTVSTRQGDLAFDEPVAAGGKDSAPTPVEGLLAALASCLVVSFKYFARRNGVRVERVEAWAQANDRRYIERIAIELEVWSPDDEEKVQALLPEAKRGCFVSALLRPDLDYQVDLLVRPSGQ